MNKKNLFFIYTALSLGTIIVLLPLCWMIITACKQPGQGLKFDFIPDRHVAGIWKDISLYKGSAVLVLEYDPKLHPQAPEPKNIEVIGSFNNWRGNTNVMSKDGKYWVIYIKKIEVGKTYEYKFIINNQYETIDNANAKDGKSSITITQGINSNRKLFDQSYIKDGKLVLKIASTNYESLKVELESGEIVSLGSGENYFAGDVNIDKTIEKYRILYPRSLSESVSSIYTLNNFVEVIKKKDFPFAQFFLNSMIVALGTAILTVILCTMAGYAFSKKTFWLKDQLFLLLLSSMMIPGMIFMVPQFVVVSKLGWLNSYQGMIVPHLANVFGLFLLKQYIDTIPNSLFQAAKLDGANEYQVFYIIIVPLCMPIMVTLFLMTFVGQWSNFLWQLIVNTPDSAYRTLPVGLSLFKGQYATDWELMMAGACFSILPIAVIFLAAQRFFVSGMTSGAVK